MPIPAEERLLTLHQAATRIPRNDGQPVHPTTVLRWIVKGTVSPSGTRVYLEAGRMGSRWMTSAEALSRFMARLTPSVRADESEPLPTPHARERAARQACQQLAADGC